MIQFLSNRFFVTAVLVGPLLANASAADWPQYRGPEAGGVDAGKPLPTTWNIQAPNEYGFYSNVNPNVSHPRWSQEQEHRIGESTFSARDTLLFNGYAEQVAHLYDGMDLRKDY